MTRRRLVAWTLLLGGLGAFATARVLREQAEARFQLARAELLAGRAEAALPAFAGLEGRPFGGARASAGRALAETLLGRAPSVPPLPARGLAAFPAEALLREARRTRPLSIRRALASLLEASGARLAGLDLAALDLDEGRDDDVRRRVAADPSLFVGRGLGREVLAVLKHRAAGPVTVVRDRTGRRLGVLAADGLRLEDDVAPALVPPALSAALSSQAAAAPNGPPPGLRASLDLALSEVAAHALGFARGSVVLLDPHTGGILAALSDPATRAAFPGGTAAFEDRREPASISKVITAAAGLRAGFDLDLVLRRHECRGSERFGNGIVWCSYAAGPLQGLDQAMALSCNMAFAHIGALVGRKAVVDELRHWGFDRDFGFAPAGRILKPEGDLRQLADLSIGLEASDITTLHGALLPTVLANEGRMPEPVLLLGEEGPMGLAPTSVFERPPAREVVDPDAVPVLARSMQAVAVYGTAAGVAPAGFPIAMKTGTGAEWRRGYHANYVGVAPWPNPVVAFSVRITHEPTSSRVNRTAREVLRTLLEGLRRETERRRTPAASIPPR